MTTYALVARRGTVAHVAVWHTSGRGAASLCRRHNAPASYDRNGDWIGDNNKLIHADERLLPWCHFCVTEVRSFAADVLNGGAP